MNLNALSTSEKILLVEQIWDSVLPCSEEVELANEQIQLLQARLTSLENDDNPGDSWENVKARILKNNGI